MSLLQKEAGTEQLFLQRYKEIHPSFRQVETGNRFRDSHTPERWS